MGRPECPWGRSHIRYLPPHRVSDPHLIFFSLMVLPSVFRRVTLQCFLCVDVIAATSQSFLTSDPTHAERSAACEGHCPEGFIACNQHRLPTVHHDFLS